MSRDEFQNDDGFNAAPQTSAAPATAATTDFYLLVNAGTATGTTKVILWDNTPSLAALHQNRSTETLRIADGKSFGDTGLSLPNATSTAFLVHISSGHGDVQIGSGRTLTQVFRTDGTPRTPSTASPRLPLGMTAAQQSL